MQYIVFAVFWYLIPGEIQVMVMIKHLANEFEDNAFF